MSLAREDAPLKGIALMCLAMSIVPVMDGIAKHLAEIGVPVLLIVWARFFFNLAIISPIVVKRHGGDILKPDLPWLMFWRGMGLFGATYFFFYAISTIPIVDALGIYFIYPLTVMALSPIILGESVGVRRWSAAIVGFLGAMIIVQPSLDGMEPGRLWAVVGSFCFGFYVVATRKLAGRVAPMMVLFHQSIPGTVILTAALPWIWVPIESPVIWGAFIAIGAISGAGHLLLIRAYSYAPASVLSPLGYFEIVSATIIGFIFFGDFPDLLTWFGIAIIVASGVYITWRETMKSTPRPLEKPLT